MAKYFKPISKLCTQKILDQMNNTFHIINDINNLICFFIKIKYKTINIPVMITNYRLINYISNKKEINIYINNEINKIEFGYVKYFNIDNDLAMIQIKENNKINFLELDEFFYDNNSLYNKESIYILNYNNNEDISVAYSDINFIKISEIIYPYFLNKNNNSFSLIFNLSNNKLIGISRNNGKYNNKKLLFNNIINQFLYEYKNNKYKIEKIRKYVWNEIEILISIYKDDINKKIYFLDKENNNGIKDLNDKNTVLYINNIRNEYKKYFIPKKEGEYNIKLKFELNLKDCSYMFANCENIIKINFISFNTSYILSMKYMFYKCKKLEYINLLSFDIKNVRDISYMFASCYNLNNLDLTSFNINNFKNMNYMFEYCYSLQNLQFFSLNTEKSLFELSDKLKIYPNKIKNNKINCDYPNEIDILIKININDKYKKIYFLDNFFGNESELNNDIKNYHNDINELNDKNTELYINNIKKEYKKYFTPEKVGEYNIKLKFKLNLKDCSYMFANCENIIKINFISFNTSNISSMKYMFYKCKNLEYINNLLLFDTRNVIDISDMFSFCYNLNNIDLSSFNINNVKNMSYMFYYCYNLKNLKLFSLNSENTINMDYIFDGCNKLNKFPSKIKDNKSKNKYLNEINIIIRVMKNDFKNKYYFFDKVDSNDDDIETFQNHDSLKELNNNNTELYINDIRYEYQKYFIPKKDGKNSIRIKFNINLTDCSYMFANCTNILEINFIHFNTFNIKSMYKMFYNCTNLRNLDLSLFDTKDVTDMSYMFYGCSYLNELKLYSFETKNVTNMSYMFYCCDSLTNLDLLSFVTYNVTDMSYMFCGCNNLYFLDLSNFDTRNVIKIRSMFNDCSDNIYEYNKSKFKKFKKEKLFEWNE